MGGPSRDESPSGFFIGEAGSTRMRGSLAPGGNPGN
jgi:hypothetical protein